MTLTGSKSIREVILFPTLRPEPGMGGLAAADDDETREPRVADDVDGEPSEAIATVTALEAAVGLFDAL